MSSSNCCFLICIQISLEAGQVLWYSHLFKHFPICCDPHSQSVWHTNKAFLELLCFFNDPADVGNLISGSSAFYKSSWNICKFTIHVLLKPGLENLEHYFASMWDQYNHAVVCTFFVIAFLWDWNENWPFPVTWPLLRFPNLLAYWVYVYIYIHIHTHYFGIVKSLSLIAFDWLVFDSQGDRGRWRKKKKKHKIRCSKS